MSMAAPFKLNTLLLRVTKVDGASYTRFDRLLKHQRAPV